MNTSADKVYFKDNIYFIYPFFLVHMLVFGLSAFVMAYSESHASGFNLYLFGIIAIPVYVTFYLAIFGLDTIKWLIINSTLGIVGIFTEFEWILSLFGKTASIYPIYIHVIPFIYYILYTFLIRRALIDFTGSRDNESRKKYVETFYIVISIVIYLTIYFASNA